MKRIVAIIKPFKLDDVRENLANQVSLFKRQKALVDRKVTLNYTVVLNT